MDSCLRRNDIKKIRKGERGENEPLNRQLWAVAKQKQPLARLLFLACRGDRIQLGTISQ